MAQILPLAPRARPVIFSGEERKAREKMPWLPIYQFNLHQALMGTLNSFQPFVCATAPCSGCTCPAPWGTGITGVHGHAQTQLQLLLHGTVPPHQETLWKPLQGQPGKGTLHMHPKTPKPGVSLIRVCSQTGTGKSCSRQQGSGVQGKCKRASVSSRDLEGMQG